MNFHPNHTPEVPCLFCDGAALSTPLRTPDGYAVCEECAALMSGLRYVVGWNVSGYLPECDVETFSDFDDAKRYLIDEVLRSADYAETEEIAENLAALAEDINLWSAPGDVAYVELIDSPHCIPTAFWVCETYEEEES